MTQLALPLTLDDHAVFETYYDKGNETPVAALRDLCRAAAGPGIWLSGGPATGKSHLLQAVCRCTTVPAMYLPLSEFGSQGPAVLEGMTAFRLICLDDVDGIAGDDDWERALFLLYIDAMAKAVALVMSAAAPARQCGFGLPDLESRFTQLPTFRLSELDEEGRKAALRLRAKHRGLELPDATADYLLSRQQRDMSSLYALLDRLDAEALAARRRLTVPFVRSVLGGS